MPVGLISLRLRSKINRFYGIGLQRKLIPTNFHILILANNFSARVIWTILGLKTNQLNISCCYIVGTLILMCRCYFVLHVVIK